MESFFRIYVFVFTTWLSNMKQKQNYNCIHTYVVWIRLVNLLNWFIIFTPAINIRESHIKVNDINNKKRVNIHRHPLANKDWWVKSVYAYDSAWHWYWKTHFWLWKSLSFTLMDYNAAINITLCPLHACQGERERECVFINLYTQLQTVVHDHSFSSMPIKSNFTYLLNCQARRKNSFFSPRQSNVYISSVFSVKCKILLFFDFK